MAPLVERRNWRPFVGLDLFVADDADDELVPEGARLAQRVAVSVVHHVEAAVHVDAHGAAEAAPDGVERRQGRNEHGGAQHDAADDARRQRPGAAAGAGARLHGDGRRRWRGQGRSGVVQSVFVRVGVGSRVRADEGVRVEGLPPWEVR